MFEYLSIRNGWILDYHRNKIFRWNEISLKETVKENGEIKIYFAKIAAKFCQNWGKVSPKLNYEKIYFAKIAGQNSQNSLNVSLSSILIGEIGSVYPLQSSVVIVHCNHRILCKTDVGAGLQMYDVNWLAMQLLLWGSKYLEYIFRIRNTLVVMFGQLWNEWNNVTECTIIKWTECKQCTL
jgi:hypothetical protein